MANPRKFSPLYSFKFVAKSIEDTETQVLAAVSDLFEAPDESEAADDCPSLDNNHHHNASLTPDRLQVIVEHVNYLSKYLRLTRTQTIVFCCLYAEIVEDHYFDSPLEAVQRHLCISGIDTLSLRPDADYIVSAGYFHERPFRSSFVLEIDKTLEKAILSGADFELEPEPVLDRYVICRKVSALFSKCEDGNMNVSALYNNVDRILEEGRHLSFVEKMERTLGVVEESDRPLMRVLFLCACHNNISGGYIEIGSVLSVLEPDVSQRIRLSNAFVREETVLQKEDIIELASCSFADSSIVKLSDNGERMLLEGDYVPSSEKKDSGVLSPADIKQKPLFYDADFEKNLDFIRQSLMPDNYDALRERLEKKAMPKGVSILFYGAPGTGKTESVLQIAKATGRKVVHVDISQSKSCYFGESEKIVKRIFARYRTLCKQETLTPILLFNEADAVFGKRKDVSMGNLAATENAIQNIILEEMESLDGILIATTNLAKNLDSAFDRRFLFKLQFERPSVHAKRNIWKSKLPDLDEKAYESLAKHYDLSGGEIDNIARKATMREVLYGERPSADYVDELCRSERIARGDNSSRVGF